jgi:hypothetical protein
MKHRLGLDRFWIVNTRRPVDIPAAVQAFRHRPEIEQVQPDYLMTGEAASFLPNDPVFPKQWGFLNTGSNPIPLLETPGADIKAVDAWEITHGDSSIVVAILDSGLNMEHPEFAGRVAVNPLEIPGNHLDDDGNGYADDVHGYDFVNNDGDPSDDLFHGTAVASVLGANGNNGSLVAGLDWSCKILPVKVINSSNFGYFSWWALGILYAADAGARVISMSLVGYGADYALQSAVEYAHLKGCFIAAAMGNDNTSNPSVLTALDFVTAVGSTDPMDDRCVPAVCGYGSNYGPQIDVVAPGTQIPILYYASPTTILYGGGTSFATPMVAGLASLLLSRHPQFTPDQLQDVIRYSADDRVGRPEEDASGFDNYYGYGRINCSRAFGLAQDVTPPVVLAPTIVHGAEGQTIAFEVTASDPNGKPIQMLTADLSQLPPDAGATFDVSANHSSGAFRWLPQYTHSGTYPVTFTAGDPFRTSATVEIVVANVNDPPTLVLTGESDAIEGSELRIDVRAGDPDGDPITALTVDPLPRGAIFDRTADLTFGALLWTPAYDQAGIYGLTFTARSTSVSPALTLQQSAIATINVEDVDTAPIVRTPGRVEGLEGVPLSAIVSVSDPDGDPITDLQCGDLPSGASFTASPDFRSGTLNWTPSLSQAGTYILHLTASSLHAADGTSFAGQGVGLLTLAIGDTPDHPPGIHGPTAAAGAEGALLRVEFQASDPDGDPMIALTASPLPRGSTFTTDPANLSGTLTWTPEFDQAGSYGVTLSAQSAPRASGVSAPIPVEVTSPLSISIANTDRAPVVTAPPALTSPEAQHVTFAVTADDPDEDAVGPLTMSGAPLGATFIENPHGHGTFDWLPTYQDAGTYNVGFDASNALAGHAVTSITVVDVNRAPEARPGGPYAGVMGVPIAFDGSASSDPDGTPLVSYQWSFGDLQEASGSTPSHTYASAGAFPVRLTVSDGALTADASTTATIQAVFPARAFQGVQDRTIRLMSAKPIIDLRVEPVNDSYENSAVESVELISNGTGSVQRIQSVGAKTPVLLDEDRNGIPEINAGFQKEDLRRLLQYVPPGTHEVPVTLEGNLVTGGRLRATMNLTLSSAGASLAASFAPHPAHGRGVLTIRVDRPGALQIGIFDPSGRLVRALDAGATYSAGYHDIAFDGRDESGRNLRSGMYFYRVESVGAVASGRIVLLR